MKTLGSHWMTLPGPLRIPPSPHSPRDPAVVPRTLGLIYGDPYKGQELSRTGLAKRWRQLSLVMAHCRETEA